LKRKNKQGLKISKGLMDRTKFNTWKDNKDQFVESHDKLYSLESILASYSMELGIFTGV
jgi:hypothetical protein